MILSQILHEKRLSVQEKKARRPIGELEGAAHSAKRGFKSHIKKENQLCLIAEVKKASPSAGVIVKDFDPLATAEAYSSCGAHAISVLTEEKFFLGSLEVLRDIKKVISLPILQKDFIIDPYQIYEASYYGADAILLIADILSAEDIKKFISICRELGLEALLEVHTQEDIEKAIASDAGIIGINNRDLHTFKVDLNTTERLIRLIPKEKVIVSESGIKTHEDVAYLRSLGVDAILVGEAFLRSADAGAKVKEIMHW